MEYHEYEGKLLGGVITVGFYGISKEISQDLFKEVYDEGLRLQKIFNFYDPESELSHLNTKRIMRVSDEFLEVLEKAINYGKITHGEYDISLGKQILERKKGNELPLVTCSFKDITIKKQVVNLTHEDILIDLGSIAKGYIGDKLSEFIKTNGVESFFIDLRGDMIAYGEREEEVYVQHPREKDKKIALQKLKNSAIATSGDYNQYYGSYENSHILRQKDLISVTVIAPTLMDADAFASAVFLSEKKVREKIIAENPQFKILTIDKNINEKPYNGF